ncbi:MAG: hypothetical protein ACJ714_10050 [Ornithinibacter sp.]
MVLGGRAGLGVVGTVLPADAHVRTTVNRLSRIVFDALGVPLT